MKTTYKIFKTIQLLGKEPSELLKELESKGVYVSSWAKQLAEKVSKGEKETVQLVKIKLSDWFTKYPTTREIRERVEKEGLELPPAQTALYLRGEYTDQPKGEWLTVFHEPVVVEGRAGVWRVRRGDGRELWLGTDYANPVFEWGLDGELLLRLRTSDLGSSTPQPSDLKTLDLSALSERVRELESFKKKVEEILKV